MSWCLNQGPSFNTQDPTPFKINGFFQRFQLLQTDNRMTPGKKEPTLKAETTKGTFKLRGGRGTRPSTKSNQIKYSDAMQKGQSAPIYSGFGNYDNKTSSKISKRGKKLKVRKIK